MSDTSRSDAAGSPDIRSVTDPRTGNVDSRFRRSDGSRGSYAVAGEGPQRVCIRPVKTVDIPRELLKDGCKAAKGEVVGDSMVSVNDCPWGRIKTTLRRLDEKTWESVTESVIKRPPLGSEAAGGLPFLRAMAEKMAREGNAQERAEAQRSLALFKQMQASASEMGQADIPPEAAAAMRSGRGALEQKTVQRLTRIGACQG
ncbi:hypothetical protein [Massilia sp. Se16.2.3]|uniref:hypothetical protein n=1 Tax=Massilia sp. Se16.2.3 TaxID=2709303 RepID=UPI0015FED6AB|nr:hypothetical protein [Massilia sp. Se16.2.3]QNA98954.1 hypothetical protein G4G31_09055 [Massilia sp. Se16.2.3]